MTKKIPLAHAVWEQDNGPVPAGHDVVHREGAAIDYKPQNLTLVPGVAQHTAFIDIDEDEADAK